jgi:hypothetical protein
MQDKPTDPEDTPAPDEARTATAQPALTPAKLAEKQRLAEALRSNLRRRKAQIRQRRAGPAEESGPQEA